MPGVDPDAILGHVRRRAFTPEEFGPLPACTSRSYRDHYVTQVGTGLRSGELLGAPTSSRAARPARLEVVDVCYDAGKFGRATATAPKTRSSIRAVPRAPTVAKAVAAKLAGCPPGGRVFCGPGGSHGVPRGGRSRLSTGNSGGPTARPSSWPRSPVGPARAPRAARDLRHLARSGRHPPRGSLMS